MKKILITFSVFILGFSYAQEKMSYKNNGKTISFKVSEDEYFIKSSLPLIGTEYKKISNNYGIVKKEIKAISYTNRKEMLKREASIQFDRIEPVLLDVDTETKLMLDGQINIKVKPNIDIKSLFGKYNFTIEQNKFDNNVYLLKSNTYSTQEIFDIVNKFQNNPNIEFIEPNFTVLVNVQQVSSTPNDTYYNNQWALGNMKVDKAWQYSRGAGIKVAVIDDGVDLQHIDLKDNLLVGYDATGNGSKGDILRTGILGENSHGTACAGIIGAVANNNVGTSGVAYEAKILPVRIATSLSSGSMITSYVQIADGINWAWQNGADVLSNSWSNKTYSSTIENAIKNAVEKGRNGKGSVVLFASGNNNSQVSFPATLPNVIAVGASSMCDERKSPNSCDFENWGSNYGSQLDIVAPGVNIYTTDVSGANGYTYSDYRSDFNGTSSACPNVAGVMALILSANPNLTQKQARDILEQSTDKVRTDLYRYQTISGYDNGTWNNEVGYGRVNALKAIQKVYAQKLNIQGSSIICDNTTQTYNIDNIDNTPIQWQLSSDIEEISRTANSITIKPKSGFNGLATLTASNGNGNTTKKIWVGKPKVEYTTTYSTTDVVYSLVSKEPNVSLEEQGITNTVCRDSDKDPFTNSSECKLGMFHSKAVKWWAEKEVKVSNICGTYEFKQLIKAPYVDTNPCNQYSISHLNSSTYRLAPFPCEDIPDDRLHPYSVRKNTLIDNTSNENNLTIQISNAMGQIVFTTKNKEFSLAHLLAGTYYARVIKNGQVVHTQTLLKQ